MQIYNRDFFYDHLVNHYLQSIFPLSLNKCSKQKYVASDYLPECIHFCTPKGPMFHLWNIPENGVPIGFQYSAFAGSLVMPKGALSQKITSFGRWHLCAGQNGLRP